MMCVLVTQKTGQFKVLDDIYVNVCKNQNMGIHNEKENLIRNVPHASTKRQCTECTALNLLHV